MKTKFIITAVILSFVFTVLPGRFCLAAEPAVTREYISRLTEGVNSVEERLCVDYKDLRMEEGKSLKISFHNKNDLVLWECEIKLDSENMIQNEMIIQSRLLQGAEYIKIEHIGFDNESVDIKIPFKI